MFEDGRSKKVILVAHCVLNQNTKLDRCAHYPGAMREVGEFLVNSGMGLLQMPCPEFLYLGLDRQVEPGANPTVEEEDTRIAVRMKDEGGRLTCRRIVDGILTQIQEYRRHGFEIAGLVGINGSPSCGVEITWSDGREREEPGALIQMLDEQLRAEGLSCEMRGVRAREPREALAALTELLRVGGGGSREAAGT